MWLFQLLLRVASQIAYILDHSVAFLSIRFGGKKRPKKAHFDQKYIHDATKGKFTRAQKDAMDNTDLKILREKVAMALEQI